VGATASNVRSRPAKMSIEADTFKHFGVRLDWMVTIQRHRHHHQLQLQLQLQETGLQDGRD